MKYLMMLAALLLPAQSLTGCSKPPLYQEEGYVFGTRVEVSIYGEQEDRARAGVAAVMQEFQRLHDMLHAWKPSELSRLNAAMAAGKPFQASPELADMLQDAAKLSAQSGGLFNPAIGGLVQLWGFHADEYAAVLPNPDAIARLVNAKPQLGDLKFSHGQIRSRNRSVQIDLGGYAKGYALDRAARILKQQGIHNALINIGGNIMALGKHGDRPWRVGIQHPRQPGPLAMLALQDGEAIGTSGDYQRYFEVGGKRYCHLIDPRSGQPVQGVEAVTVITQGASAGVLSDVASKPLFIAGSAGWREAARSAGIDAAMLVDGSGTVHLTAAMQKRLEFNDGHTPVLKIE